MIVCRDKNFNNINTWFRVQNQVSEARNALCKCYFSIGKQHFLDLKLENFEGLVKS